MKNLVILLVLGLFSTTSLFAQTDLQQKATTELAEHSRWVTLKITGITCAGCAGHIQKALSGKEGVLDYEVKYPGDQVNVKFDPKKIKSEDIRQAIVALDYKAEPVEVE